MKIGEKTKQTSDSFGFWANASTLVPSTFTVPFSLGVEEVVSIIVATPFGSTGYYRSITDSFFEIGIGLAFNNSTEQVDHVVLSDESEIKLKIVRGPAIVYTDNQEKTSTLAEGDEVVIRKARDEMQLISVH